MFSSPFIEERLYLVSMVDRYRKGERFSSPFIEERLYFDKNRNFHKNKSVFSSPFIEERLYLKQQKNTSLITNCSRPLLSRSGCISVEKEKKYILKHVLVPFYRGAVVFKETDLLLC